MFIHVVVVALLFMFYHFACFYYYYIMILTFYSTVNFIDEKEIDIPTAESNVEDQDEQDQDGEEQEYFVEGSSHNNFFIIL